MDKKYPLEASLLSRSYPSKEKIIQLLETRYALNDNPTLSLKPIEIEEIENSNKSLLTNLREEKFKYKKELKKDESKSVFKKFIKNHQRLQKKLKLKIQHYKKSNNLSQVSETLFKEYKELLKFDDFLTMNKLWISYIKDLLCILNDGNLPNIQQCLIKLSSAEFNGCFLRVLKSKNKELIGKNGIVIYDSQKFFIIVEQTNKLKLIEKKGTYFTFVIPIYDYENENIDDNDNNYLEFNIIGSRFQYRSHDRSGKKFKSKSADDL
ncbi:hypothetical protein WICMUC_002105 [Wickerhamomyces mucosus]|uniref:Ribonuclease P protein subunit n=1 Tax=Wickerhamomyces mucosus TaxID=1378264 RepID=A0A9P8TEY4_9ASCO|nr:hypothetical protein WICMUC_002105 [Wickerhamomyces mucosus]